MWICQKQGFMKYEIYMDDVMMAGDEENARYSEQQCCDLAASVHF